MAYGLSQRFPSPPENFRLLEPGAYQNTNSPIIPPNKVPFLSKSPRHTLDARKIWTHALYYADTHRKIPNCTSISSKIPRFPYEAFNEEDLEKILCQCGIENPCKCPVEEDELSEVRKDVECQALVRRRLFKGITPRSPGRGLSSASKQGQEFKILPDDGPPFYDAKVIESSAFYQGCKWSKWTSERSKKFVDDLPGPANYTIDNEPSFAAICAEKVRAYKRKTSKQYRFIEMVQRRNIIEGLPGPANYSITSPKGTDLKVLGPKADRFVISKYQDQPGPADYSVKRDFTLAEIPIKQCHAKLPSPACFGVKDVRFKPRKEEGPSPASYDAVYKPCHIQRCNLAPFGSLSKRFKENLESDDENDFTNEEEETSESRNQLKQVPTWEFRSKTVRMKTLRKLLNEPSPADLPQPNIKVDRLLQLQQISPFYSSDRRLQPWFNWIPVHGKDNTPGPAYYCLEKPKCLPAVNRGPLIRAPRFRFDAFQTPAPNEYTDKRGIEDILATHNHRLKENIENKHTFKWKMPVEKIKLSLDEKENMLLQKSIALLDVNDIFEDWKYEKKKPTRFEERTKKEKLLRCFLYKNKYDNVIDKIAKIFIYLLQRKGILFIFYVILKIHYRNK